MALFFENTCRPPSFMQALYNPTARYLALVVTVLVVVAISKNIETEYSNHNSLLERKYQNTTEEPTNKNTGSACSHS